MSAGEAAVVAAIREIPDPEIPVVSIDDLGIVRALAVDDPGRRVVVTLTPTYSGCPAMEAIAEQVRLVAAAAGYAAEVVTVLSPPWTTDWLSERGRDALREFGIAPPGPVRVELAVHRVACPWCGSDDTDEVAHFGSTACKALRRCRSCGEPFDEFKPL